MAKRQFTEAERAAAAERDAARRTALAQRVKDGVAAIQTSDTFIDHLRATSRFWRYSARNQLLIKIQDPQATYVAGFTTWKQLGRWVKRGETAQIYICQRRPKHLTDTDAATGEDITRQIVGFRYVPVWDIRQTDGKPLPPPVVPEILSSDTPPTMFDLLRTFAEQDGLSVTTVDPDPQGATYNGYYNVARRLIFVRPNPPAQMCKTLAHEIAHHLDPKLWTTTTPERETVAETAAFFVGDYFGVDTSAYSFPYLAHWTQQHGPALLDRVLERAQYIAKRMMLTLTDDVSDLESEQAVGDTPPLVVIVKYDRRMACKRDGRCILAQGRERYRYM